MTNTNKIAQVVEEIRNLMGTGYRVECRETRKNNGVVLNGITILPEGQTITPNIYIDEYLNDYSAKEIAEMVIETYNANKDDKEFNNVTSIISNFDNVTGMLSIRLINKEANLEMLNNVPYESFLDLAIIATINLSDNATIKVTNNLLETWGVSFDEVLNISKENFYAKEWQFISMAKIFADEMGMDVSEMDSMEPPMYVLRNESRLFAAGYITSDKIMSEIASKLDSDLIVIPSSIHEVIILPYCESMDIDNITQIVVEVNGSQVEPEEVLSDHAYVYRIDSVWEV